MTPAPFAQPEGAAPAPSSETVALNAIYNIDDDTIRLTCTGPDDRFPSPLLADAKAAGYRHWRGSRQLVATWTPVGRTWEAQTADRVYTVPRITAEPE